MIHVSPIDHSCESGSLMVSWRESTGVPIRAILHSFRQSQQWPLPCDRSRLRARSAHYHLEVRHCLSFLASQVATMFKTENILIETPLWPFTMHPCELWCYQHSLRPFEAMLYLLGHLKQPDLILLTGAAARSNLVIM
jgi:hypothetical protein